MSAPLRLLIVEDLESDAALVIRTLAKAGYDVRERRVESAAEMRSALEHEQWDLVIADYCLPQFDAPGALAVLKESGLDLPFIVVSGTVGEDTAVAMMKAGAHDYLMKDKLARLAPAVERELRDARSRGQRQQAETANARLMESLRGISELAVELGGAHSSVRVRAIMAERLCHIVSATAVGVSSYDAQNHELVVEHVALPAEPVGLRERIVAAFGGRLVGFRTPVQPEAQEAMLRSGLARFDSLYEVTFGAMPQALSRAVEIALGSGDIYAMALAEDDTLLGACVIAMRRGAEPIPDEVRSTITRVCSVALRRALTEESLAASRDYLDGILNAIPDPVFVKDQRHRLVLANDAECALADRPRAELLGRTDYDFFPKEQVDEFWRRDDEVLTTGRQSVNEEQITDARTGSARTIVTKKTRYQSASGERFVVGAIRDITERKRSEEALRQSEERFSTIFHASPLAVAVTRMADNMLLDVNDAWCRITGLLREEAIGRSPIDLGTWAKPRERARMIDALREHGSVQGFEFRLRTRSGDIRDLLMSAARIDLAGDACLLTMAVDVSERKRSEEALRLQEERWRLALDGAVLGTWHWDIASGRLTWSDRSYAIFGQAPGSPMSHEQFLGLIHPDDVEGVAAVIQAALSGAQYDVEYRVRWANGSEHWIAARGRTYFDAQGNPQRMEGVVRDATEQRRIEEQLRQAQKMEAIGQLAGGVAHDFNNVLGVVLGHCELAARTLHEGDPLLASVREIHAAGERAASLTRQLLAFSRRQALQPQAVDLRTVVRNLASMLRRLIGEHIELVVADSDDPLGRVKVDPGRIEQVILNLVVNARDAMPDGGRLLIETSNLELDRDFARGHLALDPGPYVLLAVTDTGCGMSAATRERLFEPFFTTKESGKGTGLGLATVYGIVKQSGAGILVYSELGHGTTFKIYFPRTEEAAPRVADGAQRQSRRGSGETILVVEDERGMREIVVDILEDLGYETVVAANGDDALAAVEDGGVRPALLLTDVVMPGMSGAALADRLELKLPSLKTLLMSGYTEQGMLRQGATGPERPFIQKPFSIDDLADKLWELLSRGDPQA